MERKTEVTLKYPVGTWLYGFDLLTAKDGNDVIQKAKPWNNPMKVVRWNIGFTGNDHPLIIEYELTDVDHWEPGRIREVYEEYLFETKEECQAFCDAGNKRKAWGSWRA